MFYGIRAIFRFVAIREFHGRLPLVMPADSAAFVKYGLRAAVYNARFIAVLVVVQVLSHPGLVSDSDGLVLLSVTLVCNFAVGKGRVQKFPCVFGEAFFDIFGT